MLHHLHAVLILNGMKCIQGSTASNRLQYLNTNMFARTLSSSSTFFYVVNTVICFVLGLGLVFSYSSGWEPPCSNLIGFTVSNCHPKTQHLQTLLFHIMYKYTINTCNTTEILFKTHKKMNISVQEEEANTFNHYPTLACGE